MGAFFSPSFSWEKASNGSRYRHKKISFPLGPKDRIADIFGIFGLDNFKAKGEIKKKIVSMYLKDA